jgi:ammonia channel protein AmtB
LAAVALISILWVAYGYSLVFAGDGPRAISQHGEALQ